jgi:hypothetical protein
MGIRKHLVKSLSFFALRLTTNDMYMIKSKAIKYKAGVSMSPRNGVKLLITIILDNPIINRLRKNFLIVV